MNLKEIKEMIDLMNKNDLSELEIEKGDFRVRLKKKGEEKASHLVPGLLPVKPSEVSGTEAPPANLIEIKSPMVGTFYRASSPETAPFTDIGEEVKEEQIICIIEAMKVMNEIKSEVKGKVKDILVENGEAVEFGQIIFLIEPAEK